MLGRVRGGVERGDGDVMCEGAVYDFFMYVFWCLRDNMKDEKLLGFFLAFCFKILGYFLLF